MAKATYVPHSAQIYNVSDTIALPQGIGHFEFDSTCTDISIVPLKKPPIETIPYGFPFMEWTKILVAATADDAVNYHNNVSPLHVFQRRDAASRREKVVIESNVVPGNGGILNKLSLFLPPEMEYYLRVTKVSPANQVLIEKLVGEVYATAPQATVVCRELKGNIRVGGLATYAAVHAHKSGMLFLEAVNVLVKNSAYEGAVIRNAIGRGNPYVLVQQGRGTVDIEAASPVVFDRSFIGRGRDSIITSTEDITVRGLLNTALRIDANAQNGQIILEDQRVQPHIALPGMNMYFGQIVEDGVSDVTLALVSKNGDIKIVV